MNDSIARIRDDVVVCRLCPRLVGWREQVAREKTVRFADQEYWGKPVPGYGDPDAAVLILGLAPAAHGGNRTGRIFTGDRSGDFLFASMYRTGYANQPTSVSGTTGSSFVGLTSPRSIDAPLLPTSRRLRSATDVCRTCSGRSAR